MRGNTCLTKLQMSNIRFNEDHAQASVHGCVCVCVCVGGWVCVCVGGWVGGWVGVWVWVCMHACVCFVEVVQELQTKRYKAL